MPDTEWESIGKVHSGDIEGNVQVNRQTDEADDLYQVSFYSDNEPLITLSEKELRSLGYAIAAALSVVDEDRLDGNQTLELSPVSPKQREIVEALEEFGKGVLLGSLENSRSESRSAARFDARRTGAGHGL